MKLLKMILSVLMVGALAWIAAYVVNTSMTEASSRELARQVEKARQAAAVNYAAAAPADDLAGENERLSEPRAPDNTGLPPKETVSLHATPAVWNESAEQQPEKTASESVPPAEEEMRTDEPEPAETVIFPDAAAHEESADRMPAPDNAHGRNDAVDGAAAQHDEGNDFPDEPDPLLAYYQMLARQNPDMIGWIRIEDTRIDYPVMHTPEEPEYYLHRDFEKSYAFEGIPFADGRCDLHKPFDNIIIYGHNMRNGGMFAALRNYMDQTFFEDHPVVTFDTLDARGQYRVFAAIQLTIGEMTAQRMRCYSTRLTEDAQQIADLDAYLQKYAAIYDASLLPKPGARVITLSTCTGSRSDRRMVVMAVHNDDIEMDDAI